IRGKRQSVIVLKRSRVDEKVSFVSAAGFKEREAGNTTNIIVLQHPDLEDSNCCYINLLHLEIYPCPDRDALLLCNRSTSDFTAHSLLETQFCKIKPNHHATLERGTWQLILGEGLTFQINIYPFTPEEQYHGCMYLSPKGPATRRMISNGSPAVALTNSRKRSKSRNIKCSSPTPQGSSKNPRVESPISIGKTPFTEVLKQNRNGIAIAVKLYRKPKDNQSADMWKNELIILQLLRHQPSVVRLLAFDASDLSLKLEYIGSDLAQYVNHEDKLSLFSPSEQHQIWTDVAKGIKHIHAQNIVYRDIKPQNILFDRNRCRTVICDFGISAKTYREPEYFTGGTPCYVPPEHLIDLPRGPESDIWAFGITMLFVFRQIPLPQGNWKIALLAKDHLVRQSMLDWIRSIRGIVEALPKQLAPLHAVLAQDPCERVTAANLVLDLQVQVPRSMSLCT
ncbi:MAG: hypothetical protein Q9179_007846, partial [Wetmoreana sp. 5 TL-2023]